MAAPTRSSSDRPSVGVIGLGAMGHRLAMRLEECGVTVAGYDPFADNSQLMTYRTLAELAIRAEVLLLMLPTPDSVNQIVEELAPIVEPGHVVVNHSTVSVVDARSLPERLSACSVLDAPMSGGTEAASAGTLTLFVGGAPETIERVGPVFDGYAARVLRCGDQGAGMAVKLLHQHVVGAQVVAFSEMFTLARGLGVDEHLAAEMLAGTVADSPMLRMLDLRLRERDSVVRGSCRILLKDLHLVLNSAKTVEVDLCLLDAASQVIGRHVEQGYGEADIASLADPSLVIDR